MIAQSLPNSIESRSTIHVPVLNLIYAQQESHSGSGTGKLTGCEDDFAHLVRPPGGTLFLKRSSVQNDLPACENHLPSCWKHLIKPVSGVYTVIVNQAFSGQSYIRVDQSQNWRLPYLPLFFLCHCLCSFFFVQQNCFEFDNVTSQMNHYHLWPCSFYWSSSHLEFSWYFLGWSLFYGCQTMDC